MTGSSTDDGQQGAIAPGQEQQHTAVAVDCADDNAGGAFLDMDALLADENDDQLDHSDSPASDAPTVSNVQKATATNDQTAEDALPVVDSIEQVLGNLEETISEIHRDIDDDESPLIELDDDDEHVALTNDDQKEIEQFVADTVDDTQQKVDALRSAVEEVVKTPSTESTPSQPSLEEPPAAPTPISNTADLDAALSRDANALLEDEFEDVAVVVKSMNSQHQQDDDPTASSRPREVNVATESVTIGDDGSVHVADTPVTSIDEQPVATLASDGDGHVASEPDYSKPPNAKPNPNLIDDETMELFGDGDDDDIEVLQHDAAIEDIDADDDAIHRDSQEVVVQQAPDVNLEDTKAAPKANAGEPLIEKLLLPVKGILTMLSLPMRMLPPKLQPGVNFVALTLAIWAPLVWLLILFVL